MPAFNSSYLLMGRCISQTIRSLDSLNDQIVQFVLNTGRENVDDPKQRYVLEPSVALMKKLLLDAQGKFRKMVEENQQLANRIDGELQSAHKEVDVLRRDLADTNKRISEMQANSKSSDQKLDKQINNEKTEIKNVANVVQPLTNGTLPSKKNESDMDDQLTSLKEENGRLAERNVCLLREVDELRFLKDAILKYDQDGNDAEANSDIKLNPKITKMTVELTHAKEALSALKVDRKRLKAEKFDLLNQMKQLYATLEDKEKELRDFIRNYEQRMKDSDESVRQLTKEREESEREKWNLLKHAREESERAVTLASQLNAKDDTLKKLEEDLDEIRKQFSMLSQSYSAEGMMKMNGIPSYCSAFTPTSSPQPVSTPTPSVSTPTCSPLPLSSTTNGRGSSADSGVRLSSDRESTASHEGGSGTPNKEGSAIIYSNPSLLRDESRLSLARSEKYISRENSTEVRDNSSSTTPVNGNTTFNHTVASKITENVTNINGGTPGNPLSRSAEQLCDRLAESQDVTPKGRCGTMTLTRKSHKGGGTWGSISRVFARQKKRAAIDSSIYDGDCNESSSEDLSFSNSYSQSTKS